MQTIAQKMAKLSATSWLIILGILFTSIAKNMVIPFFAIYLTKNMHFSFTSVGIIVAARIWGQRGLVFISGPIVDLFGIKFTLISGLLLVAMSYLFSAFAMTVPAFVIWTLILGLGGAFYTTAVKTAVVSEVSYEEKVFALSLRSTALNVGSAIGPIIGSIIFVISPKLVFIYTALSVFVFAVISQYTLNISAKHIKNTMLKITDLIGIFKQKTVLRIMIFMIFFYIFLIQIEITYPIFAASTFSNKVAGQLFLLNALVIAGLQMPLSQWIARSSLNKIFLLGMMTLSFGLILTGVSGSSLFIFFLAVAIFSVGEIIISPKLDSDISSCVPASVAGTAFGVLGIANAIGAGIGGVLGGSGYNVFLHNYSSACYWVVIGILAAMVVFIVALNSILRKGSNFCVGN